MELDQYVGKIVTVSWTPAQFSFTLKEFRKRRTGTLKRDGDRYSLHVREEGRYFIDPLRVHSIRVFVLEAFPAVKAEPEEIIFDIGAPVQLDSNEDSS